METILDYFDDTYRFTSKGQILRIANDGQEYYAVTDRTIFYPQGGGQPADRGFLLIQGTSLAVKSVRFAEGEVRHFADASGITGSKDGEIIFNVDPEARILHAKLHTAGHLIANLVESQIPDAFAIKGFHFPDGPYVEFQEPASGWEDLTDCEQWNDKIHEAVGLDFPTTASVTNLDELVKLGARIPANLPDNKPIRVVRIGNYLPIACGGTHVKSLAELGVVRVTKIQKKSGHIRFSYRLA